VCSSDLCKLIGRNDAHLDSFFSAHTMTVTGIGVGVDAWFRLEGEVRCVVRQRSGSSIPGGLLIAATAQGRDADQNNGLHIQIDGLR